MFIWASLARHAKHTSLARVLFIFIIIQCTISIPIGIMILRDPPHIFYPRIHQGPLFENFDRSFNKNIQIYENENGFISNLTIIPSEFEIDNYIIKLSSEYIETVHDYIIIITPQYIYYKDAHSFLGIPVNLLPAWVIKESDIKELFNHLALYNSYFIGIVSPVFLLIFIIIFITQSLIMLAAVWLFGHWIKLSGNMSVFERFSVCTFASIPAGIIGFATGIILPIMHIFIAQLVMIYVSYKCIKEGV